MSPEQLDLRELLTLAKAHVGDTKALDAAIGKRFFPRADPKSERTLGMNARLSMGHHGLITRGKAYELTDVADALLKTATDDVLVVEFAKHILLNLNGLQLVEVVESMQARGDAVTAPQVATELLALGIDPGTESGENINPVRLWLERAGVFTEKWNIDSSVLKKLTGASAGEISELVALPLEQRAVLRALATMTDPAPHLGSKVRELAVVQTPGLAVDYKQFAAKVLDPLEKDGWLKVMRQTQTAAGGKSVVVTPTQKFIDTLGEPLLDAVIEQAHLQDPASLRKPLKDLLGVVDDPTATNHARGLALEGVCIQVVRVLGARFVSWRLRGDQTNGAEVDVVAETVSHPYQVIQIQSKASAISGREIVDREVGVATALKSNVLLFVTAKKVGEAARAAAATYMQESNLSILFLEGDDPRAGAIGITAAMQREWQRVATVRSKRSEQRTQGIGE